MLGVPSEDKDSYTTDYSVDNISLLSECEEGNDNQEMEETEEVEADNFDGEGENEEEDAYSQEQECSSITTATHEPMVFEPTSVVCSSVPTDNFGYNINMNIRRSFQHCAYNKVLSLLPWICCSESTGYISLIRWCTNWNFIFRSDIAKQ